MHHQLRREALLHLYIFISCGLFSIVFQSSHTFLHCFLWKCLEVSDTYTALVEISPARQQTRSFGIVSFCNLTVLLKQINIFRCHHNHLHFHRSHHPSPKDRRHVLLRRNNLQTHLLSRRHHHHHRMQ